ncbi:MAG: RNA-directed DNA polymerase [Prevotella sp.]|nr:RNA-directed DNA polymerase [Prevotella sp.]
MRKKRPTAAEPMLFREEEMGGVALKDVLAAYFDCRQRKSSTLNSLAYEIDYERRCEDLWRRINQRRFSPGRSTVFIVTKPVVREIFAPAFESRIADHLISMKLTPLLEKQFIDDNYATRKGRGTLYGVKRVEGFIRECSADYTRDCYIMKLDIKSYFMNLDKEKCFRDMARFVNEHYDGSDKPTLIYLLKCIVMDNPQKHFVRHCPKRAWDDLPPSKSLFNKDERHGLPIGRLTSQLCASYNLDPLDHLVTEEWGIKYYGRYVDDIVLIDESKEKLQEVERKINAWLSERGFTLHPRKRYLQHYSKGVSFVGGVVKPGRKYISNRTIGFAYDAIRKYNEIITKREELVYMMAPAFVGVMNSYLGATLHYDAYNVRRKLMGQIAPAWWQVVYARNGYKSLAVKPRLRKNSINALKTRRALKDNRWLAQQKQTTGDDENGRGAA